MLTDIFKKEKKKWRLKDINFSKDTLKMNGNARISRGSLVTPEPILLLFTLKLMQNWVQNG